MGAQINNLAFVGHMFIFFTFGFSESKRSELSEKTCFFPWGKCATRPSPQKKGVEDDVCILDVCFFADVFSGFSLGALRKSIVKKGRWPKGGAGVWGFHVIRLHERFVHLWPCLDSG